LRGGKVASALQNQRALIILLENMKLAEGGDMVNSRIGTGVGNKNHP
jgi:hypothetical protein